MSRSVLTDASGETIAETLVSILISALALTLLATMVTTAVNIITSSKEHMNEFYASESHMVHEDQSEATSATLTFEVPLEPDASTMDVDVYSTDEDGTIVYYTREGSQP